MYLKKIELIGFKSFADRTRIEFEHGMTAIVGPNGCGKSNISDSIRWVLGEKSAKLLRGGKMEDLIFAGTQYRAPLGFAEVSLTISNEDKLFPLDYDDIVITRRLYRSGESEYMLNKTPCRLKDIHDMIMGTGIGSNAYSMIEQGEIDYIVQAKPHERRFLIEEAAGISRYKHKKDEALRKLDRTEYNFQRINDIIAEVEKNIKYAERQAKRAEKFREHFDVLRTLELAKAEIDLQKIAGERENIESENGGLVVREKEFESKIAEFQPKLEELDALIREYEQIQHEQEENRYTLKAEISSLLDATRYNEEKITEIEARNEVLRSEIALSHEKIAAFEESLLQRKNELSQFYETIASESKNLEDIRHKRECVVSEINDLKNSLRNTDSELMDISSHVAQRHNEINALNNEHTSIITKREKNNQSLARIESEENDIFKKIEVGREEVERILAAYNETQTEFSGIEERKRTLETTIAEIQEKIHDKRGSLQELDSKIAALEELAASYTSFKDGTQALIDESREENSPYHARIKTVLDTIEVSPGFEHAVQAVLSEYLYAVIVESYPEALKLLHHTTARNKLSIDVFIKSGLDGLAPDLGFNHEHVLGPLSEFVTINDDADTDLRFIFSRIIVVDSFDCIDDQTAALLRKQYHIVSKSGDVLTREGVLRRRAENEFLSGPLVQEERRTKFIKHKDLIGHELSILSEELKRYSDEYQGLTTRLDSLNHSLLDKKITLESNEKISSNIKENLNKLQEHKQLLVAETKEMESRLGVVDETIAAITVEIHDSESLLAEKKNTRTSVVSELENREQIRENIQMDIASAESTCAALREKEEYLKNAIHIVSQSCESENDLKNKNCTEIENNEARIQELHADIEKTAERIESATAEIETVESHLDDIRSKREIVTEERDTELKEINQYTKEHERIKDHLHALEVKVLELNYTESSIRERLLQAYKIEIDSFDFSSFTTESVNFDTLEDDIVALKKKVESLGTVNLLAIEEFKELQERYSFLIEQRDDLENARIALLEVIRKINRTTKQLFVDVFKQVQENFVHFYHILFGGGVAKLILVDEENPLESGVDIIVQPPGKKLQHVGLLSGGEKAMTAVALLFALFKVKPSPFCVLDEVDAPLDEANIDRFLNVVKEFSNNTQFIIVTHNRKTIAMAQTLFGVTMQEPGVSKLVSVRVSDVDSTYLEDKPASSNASQDEEPVIDEKQKPLYEEVHNA